MYHPLLRRTAWTNPEPVELVSFKYSLFILIVNDLRHYQNVALKYYFKCMFVLMFNIRALHITLSSIVGLWKFKLSISICPFGIQEKTK